MPNLPHKSPARNFSRDDLADQLSKAASGLGYFCTLTASRSEGRKATDENPRKLCDDVARALAARGIACIVGHAFGLPNKYGVEVLHVHAFTNKPIPFEFGRGWRSEYGEHSAHCKKVSETAASAARVARYVANQSGGIAAGIPKGRGHAEVLRAGVLDDVAPLIGAALDESEPSEAKQAPPPSKPAPSKPAPTPSVEEAPGEGIPDRPRERLKSAGLMKARELPVDAQFKREVFAALGVAYTFTADELLQSLIWEKLTHLYQRDPGQYRQIVQLWKRQRGPPPPF